MASRLDPTPVAASGSFRGPDGVRVLTSSTLTAEAAACGSETRGGWVSGPETSGPQPGLRGVTGGGRVRGRGVRTQVRKRVGEEVET